MLLQRERDARLADPGDAPVMDIVPVEIDVQLPDRDVAPAGALEMAANPDRERHPPPADAQDGERIRRPRRHQVPKPEQRCPELLVSENRVHSG